MSDIILLDGREVQFTIADLVLHVDDDEFRGNIDFVIVFSEPVSSKDVRRSLRLAITSRHTRELLDIGWYEETSNGLECGMGWSMLRENDLSETDIPDEIELMWEDGTIGTFALGRKGTMESSDSATGDSQQAVAWEDGDAIPDELRVDDFSQGLTIFVRWYNPALFFLFFFSIIWISFTFYFIATAGWLPLQIWGSMFSVAGFGMMYYAVCMFTNHTRIEVLHSELTRSYGPLPWPKLFQWIPVKIPVSEITSVWTERYRSGRNDQGVRTTLYCVKVSTREGEDVTLASSFTRPEPAAFIRQKLQESLGSS
ncbi:MAG: hypothetical protein GY903_03570 [Fuerstiella sp.]|nr:hypothetical protein [Fuerstiella sp.]